MKFLDEGSGTAPLNSAPRAPRTESVLSFYLVEALGSFGGTLLTVGIFFYMKDRFGWQMRENFLLAAVQGAVYVVGAMLAGRLTGMLDRKKALAGLYAVNCIAIVMAWLARSPLAVTATLLAYTFLAGLSWPILESLVSSGVDALGLSRRIAVYNMVWPAVGALAIAVEGTILSYWPAGVFLLTAGAHGVAALLMIAKVLGERNSGTIDTAAQVQNAGAHAAPEPELLRVRRLALWMSRTALPATYTVIYGLMPMMPSLPVMERLPTRTQTLVSSTWLITRWLAFALLALGTWWHTRPRVLLWSAVVMLVAFFGMTLSPSQLFPNAGISPAADLVSLIAWQALLGAALGMIYSGSLYFGMVLSEGSTEHGGYHEALIGLGWVLGPAAGSLTQFIKPGDVRLGITAVGTVIALSVLAVVMTPLLVNRARLKG